MMQKKTKFLIVEDHAIVRQGIKMLLGQSGQPMEVFECSDTSGCLKILPELDDPPFVILDLSLGDQSSLDLIPKIIVLQPKAMILILSMHDELLYAQKALKLGAKGYLMKLESSESLLESINKILKGEIAISKSISNLILRQYLNPQDNPVKTPLEKLTPREVQVFNLLADGQTSREIALNLGLSKKTIDCYREHIKEKLELKNHSQLVSYASKLALPRL